MNIVINNPQKADCFAVLFQHIKVFTEHVNMIFDKDKMYIQSMDNANVSIFEINLPKEWFDIYELTGDSNIVLGISSSLMYRILNAREKNQQIKIVYEEPDTDKLMFHFTGENKNEFEKHFEIPLMDIDSEMLIIPAVEYQAEFSIASANFSSIINQLKMFGDTMDIECSETNIVLYANSQEQGKMFVEIKIEDLTEFSIDENENIKLSFSLTYLHHFCLYHKLSKEIEIKISRDYPLKVVYLLGGCDNATMVFYLAPKIVEDD